MGLITVKFINRDNVQWVTIPVEDGEDPPEHTPLKILLDDGSRVWWTGGEYTRYEAEEEDPPWVYCYNGAPLPWETS